LTQCQTAAAQQTQEETCGKKSSIGSENRQRCSRRFRTSVMVRSVPPRSDRVALKARRKILPSAPLYCVSCCVREEPSLRGGHGKSGSLIRSSALLPRSKLGTRHTQTTCTLPPDNRQNAVVSNRFGGSRPRRSSAPRARRSTWRGDRHPVRCRWRVGASLRLGGGLHGSARRRCADCTTPAPLPRGSGAPHMKTGRGCAFRMRSGAVHKWEWCSGGPPPAPLPCAVI